MMVYGDLTRLERLNLHFADLERELLRDIWPAWRRLLLDHATTNWCEHGYLRRLCEECRRERDASIR